MSNRNKIVLGIIVIIVLVLGYWKFMPRSAPATTVSYICKGGDAIVATYVEGVTKPPASPDLPPTPGGEVKLRLSDGRTMTLPQTISADGARYANADESFIFWEKGNGVIVLENDKEKDYQDCVALAPEPAGKDFTHIYTDSTLGYSIRFPEGYTTDPAYEYTELGPERTISGTKFIVASTTAAGTNLGSDSYLSVESIPNTQDCSAGLFLDTDAATTTVTEGDMTWSVASSTGAGAGNRYEETVYALPGTNPCIAVRYFIHYSVLENYPAGAVKAFDKAALLSDFDAIRNTLTIAP